MSERKSSAFFPRFLAGAMSSFSFCHKLLLATEIARSDPGGWGRGDQYIFSVTARHFEGKSTWVIGGRASSHQESAIISEVSSLVDGVIKVIIIVLLT